MNKLPSVQELRNQHRLLLLKEYGNLPSIDMLHTIKIDFDVYLPSYGIYLQRAYSWKDEQKQKLIMSIILKVPIPAVSICLLENKTYQVIDGKQRLSTMMAFVRNQFPLIFDGIPYFYDELPKDYKAVISSFKPTAYIVQEDHNLKISDEMKIKWYLLIDNGTAQEESHKNMLKVKMYNL